MTRKTLVAWTCLFAVGTISPRPTAADPTLKGPLSGVLEFDAETGLATYEGSGRLTLMGRVAIFAELQFLPGEGPGSVEGAGVAALVAANGDVLVANVEWVVGADGGGALEFRWPGEVTFSNGTTVESSGRFVELPFKGLRATSTLESDVDWGDGFRTVTRITMTGEIVDPDPLD